jgi:hypothetical protein
MGKNWILLNCGAEAAWRRLDGTDRVRNEEELHRIKEDRNILHEIKRKKS